MQKRQILILWPKTQFQAFHTQNLIFLQNLQNVMLCIEHANEPTYPNAKCTQNKVKSEEKQPIT